VHTSSSGRAADGREGGRSSGTEQCGEEMVVEGRAELWRERRVGRAKGLQQSLYWVIRGELR
jgi:hypothetical protein